MKIRAATIDIIGSCQNRCSFCYNKDKKTIMDFARFKNIIESHPSLERINIGGGEPFLNPLLALMAGFALSKKLSVDVSTNGLIPSEKILRLAELMPGLFGFQINTPAAEEKTYDAITGTTGNFGKFMENLKLLAGSEAKPRLRLTLCRENFDQVAPVAMLARELSLPLNIDLMVPTEDTRAERLIFAQVEDAYITALQVKLVYPRIYPGWKHYTKTTCPAVAKAYALSLEKGCCSAEKGEKIYVNADGSEKRCEFLE